MDCLNDRITIPQKTTTQQFGFLLTSERSLCMLVMNFSRSVAASTFAPIRSTSRYKNQVGQEAEGAGDHLVGEQGAEGGGVLHDQRCDWQEG